MKAALKSAIKKAQKQLADKFAKTGELVEQAVGDLNELLQPLGLRVALEQVETTSPLLRTGAGSGGHKAGAKSYWAEVKKIAKDQGISVQEARKVRADQLDDPKPAEAKSSLLQNRLKAYWKRIRKIKKDEGVDTKEARDILKRRSA